MQPSRKLTHLLLALFALTMMSMAALAADPGLPYPVLSEVSDQKAGSLLVYNLYSSSATSSNSENTRINITNTNIGEDVSVHLFFVASSCAVADAYICLTANQTASFLTSDFDPGFSGFIVAYATNDAGLPAQFNYLIGDEYIKLASGHSANLGAEAFSKINNTNVVSGDGTIAALFFDGLNLAGSYNQLPRVLASDNIPSRVDGNNTLIVLNRISGNLSIGGNDIGPIFGLLYDDAENALSFTTAGGCQLRLTVSDSTPRTVPRFSTFIPSGRSGWMKLWASQNDGGILGAQINFNANAAAQANAFNSGHNLHKLTFTSASNLVVPVYPPSC